jgi:hypothetical protein
MCNLSIQYVVTDQSLLNLQSVFPRSLALAALDLVDRGNGWLRYPYLHPGANMDRSLEMHRPSATPLQRSRFYGDTPCIS